MIDNRWVRELTQEEKMLADTAQSGDRLPDGSVYLRIEDINRMGLEALRGLLFQKVVQERSTLVLGSNHPDAPRPLLRDEIL